MYRITVFINKLGVCACLLDLCSTNPKPKPNDTAKTITGLASTSYLMNQAEMSTLRQRMGDLTVTLTLSWFK